MIRATPRSSDTPLVAAHARVDVWVQPLARRVGAQDVTLLSDEERGHASRLRVGAGAWAAGRTALRRLLGRYLDVAPATVLFQLASSGKPRLAPGAGADLRFNLSHSDGMAIVAVRLGADVGVDLERIRDGVDTEGVSRELGLPPASGEAFFWTWVRNEALAKAAGQGIAGLRTGSDAARFTVRELGGIPGFAAAVASEGDAWTLRLPAARMDCDGRHFSTTIREAPVCPSPRATMK